MVAEEDGFDDGAEDGFFVVGELVDGFEVEAEVVVGAASVFVEDESGCGGGCFIAADLGDVDADAFGEGVLGERSLLAAGADLDLQDQAGFTPLHLAAQEYAVDAARGRGGLIRILREHGADPDQANRHGQTPRGLAELIGNFDVAPFLEG